MDYTDAGYTPFLTKDIPLVKPVDSLTFQQNFEGISGDKILSSFSGDLVGSGINADNITAGQMSFDRARGGSLILGGRNNQNGIFALEDENSVDKITMDKDGMTINKGALTVKDDSSNTILDSQGLSSTNNFKSGVVTLTGSDFTTASDSMVSITGLTLSFTVRRGQKVLFGTQIYGGNGDITISICGANFQLYLDGSAIGPLGVLFTYYASGGVMSTTNSISHIANVAPGAHTIEVKIQRTGGTGSALAKQDYSNLYYILLGS